MPSVRKHCELSKRRTGKTYRELHEWMDPWTSDTRLAEQRHDVTNIPRHMDYVRKTWGEEGVKEFLQHIKDDYKTGFVSRVMFRLTDLFKTEPA